MHFKEIMDFTSKVIDAAGVAVIVIGALYATISFMRNIFHRKHGPADPYRDYRETVARSILLGLEFLIAGDIIRTVAVAPTFNNLGTLAILVVIRTFLSVELEVEIEGYWPWQRKRRFAKGQPVSPA